MYGCLPLQVLLIHSSALIPVSCNLYTLEKHLEFLPSMLAWVSAVSLENFGGPSSTFLFGVTVRWCRCALQLYCCTFHWFYPAASPLLGNRKWNGNLMTRFIFPAVCLGAHDAQIDFNVANFIEKNTPPDAYFLTCTKELQVHLLTPRL